MSQDEVSAVFEDAVLFMSSGPAAKASSSEKLEFYGLFKQVRKGDCKQKRPGVFSVEARAKHDAWASREGLGSDEAMQAYVDTVAKMNPDWRSWHGLGARSRPRDAAAPSPAVSPNKQPRSYAAAAGASPAAATAVPAAAESREPVKRRVDFPSPGASSPSRGRGTRKPRPTGVGAIVAFVLRIMRYLRLPLAFAVFVWLFARVREWIQARA